MGLLDKLNNNKVARILAVSVVGLIVVVAAYVAHDFFGSTSAAKASNARIFMDADTGKPFNHEIVRGESFPIKAPSGNNSGYPAELCYWTKDGKISDKPVPVLLKLYLGQPGPTFCPDCGRLVIAHNPMPDAGSQPPPDQAQYAAAHLNNNADDAESDDGR
jgi:hypothetical protein